MDGHNEKVLEQVGLEEPEIEDTTDDEEAAEETEEENQEQHHEMD